MAIVNILAFPTAVLLLFITNAFASAISVPQLRSPQRSTPRSVPYQSLKSELPLSISGTFPSRSPTPDETIGAYLDATLDNLSSNESADTDIDKRNLVRTSTLLESLWYDGQAHFNVSIMKCITFSTIAGPWILTNGTVNPSATLLDINQDLQVGSGPDPEQEYGSRVLVNARAVLNGAEQYMKSAICGYDSTSDPLRDELRRKLLAVDGYWIATLYKSVGGAAVSAGVYAGYFNPRNHTTTQVVAAGIAGAGITIIAAVVDRLQQTGRLTAIEASILSVLVSWYNQAVHAMTSGQIGPDNALSGQNPCISKDVVEDAIRTMANFYDVETGFTSGDPQLDAIARCGKHP